eukprot:1632606-Ditylum_brightwellii.AAC.1
MIVVRSKVVEMRNSGIWRKEIIGEVIMLLDMQAMAGCCISGHITGAWRLCFGGFCVIVNEKEDTGFVIGLWSKNHISILYLSLSYVE